MPNDTKDKDIKPNKGDIESALRFGAAMGTPRAPLSGDNDIAIVPEYAGTPYVVLPEGYSVHDLEHLLPTPMRKRGEVRVSDAASLIAYANRHKDGGYIATIYAAIDTEKSACKLVAIFDDHTSGDDGAGWREHRCVFEPALSVEWKRWTGKNGAQMTQTQFATWLEDNLGDIVSVPGMPTGTQMLAMALQFEATAEKRLASRINLQNGGMRFEYVEDEDKNTRTAMDVFSRFTLGLPVFDGSSDAYPVEARLKYRDNSGKLSFWYELIRPDRAYRTAVQSTLDTIRAATEILVINGAP